MNNIIIDVKYPGQVLKTILGLRGIKQCELAKRMHCWDSEISAICLGKLYLGHYYSAKLDFALNTQEGFWRKLQRRCDAGSVTMKIGVSFDD